MSEAHCAAFRPIRKPLGLWEAAHQMAHALRLLHPHVRVHGPPPHRIKLCITKKGNEKFWRVIEEVAAAGADKEIQQKRQ